LERLWDRERLRVLALVASDAAGATLGGAGAVCTRAGLRRGLCAVVRHAVE
jgi:hypothetical protein